MPRNPTAAQRAALAALLDKYGPIIRTAFMDAVYLARARVDVGALIEALDRGALGEAAEMLRMEQGDFSALREAIRQTYFSAGSDVGSLLPRQIAAAWGFDGQNQRAQALLEANGAALVQGIVEDAQEAVRRALVNAIESPRTGGLRAAALDITGRMSRATGRREGGIVGLTSEMTDWVINARADLTNLDRRYFTRKLRDRRFDRTVAAAIRDGRSLTQKQIDRITGRYKDRMLAYRGKKIAEDQAFRAQAESREEAMLQVIERPDVEDVTRKWQLGFPKEHRENHVALAGKVVSLGERYDLGNGITARCPHDADLPIGETAGCRCSAVYRVKLKRGV
jgi:hypothetical protein